jgi:hypothetical protein
MLILSRWSPSLLVIARMIADLWWWRGPQGEFRLAGEDVLQVSCTGFGPCVWRDK